MDVILSFVRKTKTDKKQHKNNTKIELYHIMIKRSSYVYAVSFVINTIILQKAQSPYQHVIGNYRQQDLKYKYHACAKIIQTLVIAYK